jgi:outer membrane protein OmpA-like peptidoglycan-associated protein
MKLKYRIGVSVAVIAALSACSAAPKRIESLEMARTIVPQVETSARAGVAATHVANARKSLDMANRLVESGGQRPDIEYEAETALMNAQIAQEKILTAEAQEQIESGTAKRQAVLLQARERDIERSASDARDASAQADASRLNADASQQRADSLETELADLRAKRTERGVVLTLGDVLFDTGQAVIRTGAYGTLDRLAATLKDRPARSVIIEGHTDNVGSDTTNALLSEQRAQSVQSALLQRGVASSQVSALGKGESSPVADNATVDGRQQNRRVELIFTEDGTHTAVDHL